MVAFRSLKPIRYRSLIPDRQGGPAATSEAPGNPGPDARPSRLQSTVRRRRRTHPRAKLQCYTPTRLERLLALRRWSRPRASPRIPRLTARRHPLARPRRVFESPSLLSLKRFERWPGSCLLGCYLGPADDAQARQLRDRFAAHKSRRRALRAVARDRRRAQTDDASGVGLGVGAA